jgi:hypothetical protein
MFELPDMDRNSAWLHLETSLMSLVGSMSAILGEVDRVTLTDFIENREFGVALEMLHSIIIKRNLQLSEQQETEIRQLAELMNIDLSNVT